MTISFLTGPAADQALGLFLWARSRCPFLHLGCFFLTPRTFPAARGKFPPVVGVKSRRCRNKARNPSLTLAGLGHPRRDLRSRSEDFLTYIVQYHPVEGEHGSNEFQIAHLLIDSK